MDEEKLISIVSGYPEIYDMEHEEYMNYTRKANIWKEIGTLMGLSGEICKNKWKSLRDAYQRSLKRRKSKSGDGATLSKKWRFERQMEFLRPYFQERNTITNIETTVANDDDDQAFDLETATSPSAIDSPRSSTRTASTPDFQTATSPISQPGNCSETTKSKIFKNITTRKKNKEQYHSPVANVLEKYLDSRKTSDAAENPVYSFFKAMADTVVGLSPDLQLKVKNQVYTIVSQAESENLRQRSTSSEDTFQQQHLQTHMPTSVQQQHSQTQMPTSVSTALESTRNDTCPEPEQEQQQQSQSILQPNPQIRYQYFINPDGEITYEKI